MITQIHISNFKAIRDSSLDLTPVHLLIGPNDSGKTSVLEAIAAICRSVDHDISASFLGRWTGRELVHSASDEPVVRISAMLRDQGQTLQYRLQVEFPGTQREAVIRTAEVDENGTAVDLMYNATSTLTDMAVRHVSSQPEISKRSAWSVAQRVNQLIAGCWLIRWSARNLALPTSLDPGRRFRLEGNGFGLPTLLDDLLSDDRDNFSKLEKEFTEIFPHVRSIGLIQQPGFRAAVDRSDETLELHASPGKQIIFRLGDSKRDLPASQAAEGMLYILAYLALMHLAEPPRVLLIEEPENGIHPNRVRDIVRILRELVQRHPATQIVMTSHSPYLVDAFQPEEVTWCHRDSSTNDVRMDRLDTLPNVEQSLSVFSLGEIWTGELEPQANELKGISL